MKSTVRTNPVPSRIALLDISQVYSNGLSALLTAIPGVTVDCFKSQVSFLEQHMLQPYPAVCIHVYPHTIFPSLRRLLHRIRKAERNSRVSCCCYTYIHTDFLTLCRLKPDAAFLASDDTEVIVDMICGRMDAGQRYSPGLLQRYLSYDPQDPVSGMQRKNPA